MDEILNRYYENNAKKLCSVVNRIFYKKYGGIADKDMEEFYSVANDVFADIILHERYDSSKGEFDGFLYGALDLAIIDEFKKQNRDKRRTKIEVMDKETGLLRRVPVPDVYMDAPLGKDGNATVGDMLPSQFDIEAAFLEKGGNDYDENTKKFFNSLSKVQRQIIKMKIEGMSSSEMKEKLGLNDTQFTKNCNELKTYRHIKNLCRNDILPITKEENCEMEENNNVTLEKSKEYNLSVVSIAKKMDKHTLRFDHPLQRESDQWNPSMKGNLISDILQGNPIPSLVFAEQVVNGIAVIWNLDGKQKCTNAYMFMKDGYKISKNIRRYMIGYQSPVMDTDKNILLDENNFPVYEQKEFDIRGKKFSDLPEELQERFTDYSFKITQYLNCSSEDIAYHIARYNDGKPMNVSQKGITRLGETFAEMVKSISCMPFFKDIGGYKVSEFKNDTINRVVIESVMATNFIDDWKKKQEDMCEYIKENASTSVFDDFEDMVVRLEKVVTEDVADMFNSKDSFLWFGLFARFIQLGKEDERFIEFMAEFSQSLHSKLIDGVAFDTLNEKSTKDKNVVIKKMRHLGNLMYEYFGIVEGKDDFSILDYIRNNVDTDIEEEDIELYRSMCRDYLDEVSEDSKMRDDGNITSLLILLAYACKTDEDNYIKDWIVSFNNRNITYYKNQIENYLYMKNDFDNFVACKEKRSA